MNTIHSVVAVQPTVGWYAILTRSGLHEPLEAVPIEYATVHADGQRILWIEDLRADVSPLRLAQVLAVVRSTADASHVQWSATEDAEVLEESTASWRPHPSA